MTDTPKQARRVGITPAHDTAVLVKEIRDGKWPDLGGKRERFFHDRYPNLHIRVLDTNKASWTLQWRRFGRLRSKVIGNVQVLDRLAAVKKAKIIIGKVEDDDFDPARARRDRMRAMKTTLATVAPQFFADRARANPLRPSTEKYWKRYAGMQECNANRPPRSHKVADYFKPIRDMPLDELNKANVKKWRDNIADTVGGPTARKCFDFLHIFLKWARDEAGLLPEKDRVATDGLRGGLPAAKERTRVLNDNEIRSIWKACEDWIAEIKRETEEFASTGRRPRGRVERTPTFAYMTQLMFFTGCRIDEIGGLKLREIERGLDRSHNTGELLIHGTRRKARKKHEEALTLNVPLAWGAVEILRQLALRHPVAPQRDGTECFFGKGGKKHGLRTEIDKHIKKAGRKPIPDWRPHDIRRTFRTRLARLGVADRIAEMLVGHLGGRDPNDRTYNQHDYWSELSDAIIKWEQHLREIIDGTVVQDPRSQYRRHLNEPNSNAERLV
jgi:integrase